MNDHYLFLLTRGRRVHLFDVDVVIGILPLPRLLADGLPGSGRRRAAAAGVDQRAGRTATATDDVDEGNNDDDSIEFGRASRRAGACSQPSMLLDLVGGGVVGGVDATAKTPTYFWPVAGGRVLLCCTCTGVGVIGRDVLVVVSAA